MQRLGVMPQPIARYYFKQLLEGLYQIHQNGLYHGDIKLENLLLTEEFQLKLSDFGFSNKVETTCDGLAGTEGYFAPELYTTTNFDRQV
jgi:serine/threonine protein kinase